MPGGVRGQVAGLGQRPAHPAVPADEGGLVGDGQDGGEADPEPADRVVARVSLGGGAQGGQRLDTARVERGAGVGGDEDAVAQGEPEPAGHAGARGGVGGVLRQLDDQPVAVAAEDEVLLRVGVLTEPGRARRPGIQHPAPQTCRAERVGTLGGRPYEHAHGDSPLRRTTKVPRGRTRPAARDRGRGGPPRNRAGVEEGAELRLRGGAAGLSGPERGRAERARGLRGAEQSPAGARTRPEQDSDGPRAERARGLRRARAGGARGLRKACAPPAHGLRTACARPARSLRGAYAGPRSGPAPPNPGPRPPVPTRSPRPAAAGTGPPASRRSPAEPPAGASA